MNNKSAQSSQKPEPILIREKITRKLLRAVMAQFSSLPEALLELVDNAFDEFRHLGSQEDLVENNVLENKCYDRKNQDSKKRPYQMPSENFQMFQERHLVLILLCHIP